MVQYAIVSSYTEGVNKYGDSYWKVTIPYRMRLREMEWYLTKSGYQFPRGSNLSRATEAMSRCKRGLLSYRRFAARELRAFCTARHLQSRATTVHGLARVLEKADEQAVFSKFMDLPPEIRCIIYEFYFFWLEDIPIPHRQPPLTIASSQVRTESLPLFYQVGSFNCRWHTYTLEADLSEYHTLPHSNALRMLEMPEDKFNNINSLRIELRHTRNTDPLTITARLDSVEFTLTKRGEKKPVQFDDTLTAPFNSRNNAAINEFLEAIGYWVDEWSLQKEHLVKIAGVLHDSFLRRTIR